MEAVTASPAARMEVVEDTDTTQACKLSLSRPEVTEAGGAACQEEPVEMVAWLLLLQPRSVLSFSLRRSKTIPRR